MALNYNQKANIVFRDADILTARHWNCLNGIHGNVQPTTEKEREIVSKYKSMSTYDEIKKSGCRTPYKHFMLQFN